MDSRSVEVTGCIEAAPSGRYVLAHVGDRTRSMDDDTLGSDSDAFSNVVGHLVSVERRIGDGDYGTVEIKTKTKFGGGVS